MGSDNRARTGTFMQEYLQESRKRADTGDASGGPKEKKPPPPPPARPHAVQRVPLLRPATFLPPTRMLGPATTPSGGGAAPPIMPPRVHRMPPPPFFRPHPRIPRPSTPRMAKVTKEEEEKMKENR